MSTKYLLIPILLLGACVEPTPEAAGPDAAAPEADLVSLPDDDPEAIALLQGNTCAPRACVPGECGLVDDGCRAEMWCGECACGAYAMACEKSLTQIWEHTLTAGTYTIQATAISPTSIDPVMHVINASGTEYAYDDNSAGGTLPRITITVPAGQTRIVVMRPKYDTPSGGVATVQINGAGYIFGVRGRRQLFYNLRAGEEIESIQLPPSTATHTIYAMSSDGVHIQGRVRGNGTAGGAVFTQALATSSRVFWLGTGTNSQQPTRLIRNDRAVGGGHDFEGDGLGYELEAALGTCGQLSGTVYGKDGVGFSCANAVDARDTDGDGLSDGYEVRGHRWVWPHLPLARWGANPRHKDLFAEVDGSQITSASETPPKMTAAQARFFSDVYGDRLRDLTPEEKSAHASTLRNPDGRPGIRTHLDIGIAAETPADYTVYGNWGGYSWVPPTSPGTGMDPGVAWKTYLNAGRVAIFRYALMWNGDGGQTSTSQTCEACGSYAWGSANQGGAPLDDRIAHESGHAQAIAHSGPAGVHPEIDPNCKANWPSIMNYGFTGAMTGFADGTGLPDINNAHVTEWNAVNPAWTNVVNVLQNLFQYKVDAAGNVDWNRDGVFAPAGTTVRAYVNNRPGVSCEYTRYNSQMLTTQMNTTLSPAMARLGDRLYVFSSGANVRYVSSTDAFDCPVGKAACGSFGGYATGPLDATRGVDAAVVTDASGNQALLVVAVNNIGWSYSAVLRADGTWSTPVWTGIWGLTAGEPALETLPDGRALLVFRQDEGTMLYGVYGHDASEGNWERWGPAMQCGAGNLMQSTTVSPGLTRVGFNTVGDKVWGLFTSTAGYFYLRSFDAESLCFRDPEAPLSGAAQSWQPAGRPSGAWVSDPTNALGGKLVIAGMDANADATTRPLTQLWSYVDRTTGQLRVGLSSGFDSYWAYAYGIDLWHAPGESNLRAVWSLSPTTSPGNGQRLLFYPRADGINDFEQVNYDDWTVLRYAICRNVVNPYGNNPGAIQCPPRPW